MDLVFAGIEIAAVVAPTIGALLVMARQRSLGERQHRAEIAALRFALVGERLAPIDLASYMPANGIDEGSDIDSGYGSVEQTRTRRLGVTTRTMAEIVQDVLAARYAAAGLAPPLTSPDQRDALASCLVEGFRGARQSASEVGLTPRRADLPEGAPFALQGRDLLYRAGPNEEAWILCGVALKLLARAGIESNAADAWLLASTIAHGYALLDVQVVAG